MCNRFSQLTPEEQLARRFELNEHGPTMPAYNLAPTEEAQVIIEEEQGNRRLLPMIFGLIPSWAKDAKIATKLLNARGETVNKLPAFRNAFKRRRCLVPVDGFYDWEKRGKERLPYRFTLDSDGPFGLAGLWDVWQAPSGRKFRTFCIVTTDANSLLAKIHDRMPVIITKEDERLWLSSTITEERTLLPLLKPYPSGGMRATRVSTAVNSPRNKGADCIEPIVEESDHGLFSSGETGR